MITRPCTWPQLLASGPGRQAQQYLPILRRTQRLGLVAPCLIREWMNWWQQVDFLKGRLPIISLSKRLR